MGYMFFVVSTYPTQWDSFTACSSCTLKFRAFVHKCAAVGIPCGFAICINHCIVHISIIWCRVRRYVQVDYCIFNPVCESGFVWTSCLISVTRTGTSRSTPDSNSDMTKFCLEYISSPPIKLFSSSASWPFQIHTVFLKHCQGIFLSTGLVQQTPQPKYRLQGSCERYILCFF